MPDRPTPARAPAQAKASDRNPATRDGAPRTPQPPWSLRPNRTGLPDRLKAGVEALSGFSMDDVRVHRNSSEPAKLGALAYARGSDIHLASGQEKHLAHEAWHVVQQKQGRVRAQSQLKGLNLNDDPVLEREADALGARALESSLGFGMVLHERRPTTAPLQAKCSGLAATLLSGRLPPQAGAASETLQMEGLSGKIVDGMEGYLEGDGDFVWLAGGASQGKDLSHVHLFSVTADEIKGQITIRRSLEKGGPKFSSAVVLEDDIRTDVLAKFGTDKAGRESRNEIVEGLRDLITSVIDQWEQNIKGQ